MRAIPNRFNGTDISTYIQKTPDVFHERPQPRHIPSAKEG